MSHTNTAPGAGGGATDHGALTGLEDDDHTQYQRESEKSAASGYASLDGSTLVPVAELGTGTADSTKFLRGDRTWAVPAGGSAGSPSGATVVRKTADETVTSSTTLQDDDHLLFAIGANETWAVRFVLFVDGATGGDIKFHVNGPSGVGGRFAVLGPGTAATAFEDATVNNQAAVVGSSTGLPAGTLGATNRTMVIVEALVVNGATAGNVTLQWAQNTSNATASTVFTNSFLVAMQNDTGAWTTYTPSWTADTTNPAIGNGTIAGAYRKIGKTLYFRISITAGSTTTFGSGDWFLSLPSGLAAKTGVNQAAVATARDTGTAFYLGHARFTSAGTTMRLVAHAGIRWNSTTPFTWVNGDELEVNGVIEID